jgi:type I restriction enzyme M protein
MTGFKNIAQAALRCSAALKDTIDTALHKDYILSMLFLKYLSDTYREVPGKRQCPFTIKEKFSFQALSNAADSENIGRIVQSAMKGIEADNPGLRGIFSFEDFNGKTPRKAEYENTAFRRILKQFTQLDLRPSRIEEDAVGRAFEFLIQAFSRKAPQNASFFYTPPEVSEIISRIIDVQPGELVYDPACGSGSLLIRAANNQARTTLYGQDVNASSFSLAKMNMYAHGIKKVHIACGNTLTEPAFLNKKDGLMRFNAIVSDTPFSLKRWAEGINPSSDRFHRFKCGVPPASRGDWAFLLHMIASCAPGGRIASVVPHGILFHGAAEGRIRRYAVEQNLIDAVIGLPERTLPQTGIPPCILILKKGRKQKSIVFIDASKNDARGEPRYRKSGNQNILTENAIKAVVSGYKQRKNIEGFVYAAPVQEIKNNDYDLAIPRYLGSGKKEALNIKEIQNRINRIHTEISEIDTQILQALKELGIR